MGRYSSVFLDRDRAFDINSLEDMLRQEKAIFEAAKDICGEMERSILAISGIYSEIEENYKARALGADIADLSGNLKGERYDYYKNQIDALLSKLINQLPAYDDSLAKGMDGIQEVYGTVKNEISDLMSLLETGDVDLGYKEFAQRLNELKGGWNKTSKELKEILTEIEDDMLGVTAEAVHYMGDPINLSTGNFVYDHEDIKIGGEIPLSFHRYYNAKDRRKESLGRCFTHNYESRLEESEEKRKVTIFMGDGQKKTFKKLEDGTYQSLYSATEILAKDGENYTLLTLTEEKTFYNAIGQMIRQENRYGRGITFSYNKAGKLERAETDNDIYFTYKYNDEGMLTCVTDHTGRRVEISYERGKIAAVRIPSGRTYTYRYGKNGRMEEMINPRGHRAVKNTYDEKRRVIRQEFPDGGHMEFLYDDKKRRTILIERNGSRTIYVHDSKYRDTDILYEDGTKEHFGYNEKNQRILHTDRNGNTTRMAYDNRGNLTQVINALGEKTNLTYNAANQLINLKVNGKEKLHNIYDKNRNLISSVRADGTGNHMEYDGQGRPMCIIHADKSATKITYDAGGNITNIRDAGGAQVSYRYDSLNRVVRSVDGNGNATVFEYNDADKVSRVTDPLGACRSYSYNESGKITEVTDYDGYTVKADYNEIGRVSRITDKEGNTTEYSYDSMWNISLVRHPDGGVVAYQYDGGNRLCEEGLPEGGSILYTYDGNGNRTGITDAEGNHTVFVYDALDRMIKATDAAGAETCYDYDEEGNLTCITDALGNKTTYAYDGMKRCISETDALGNTTAYAYDVMGNLTGIRYPDGGTEERIYRNGKLAEHRKADGSAMRYAYDANGNCICMENGIGEKISITYDALDRRETVTDPDGGIVRYEYDALGNMIRMTDGNGNESRYTYTPNGNLSSVTDALGNETRYTYDSMGNPLKIERTAESGEIQTTTYQWDTRGRVTSIKDPLGAEEFFGYDRNGRLTDKWDRDGYHTAYGYDRRGLLRDILYGDGNSVSYSYDALGRLEEARDAAGVTRIVKDALGRVTSVAAPDGKTTGYEWGSMGERRRLIYPDGKEAAYSYNEKGQLASLSTGRGTITYTYDGLGRLKEKKLPNGVAAEYTYTGAGRLERIRHTGTGFEEEYSYGYDRAGNKIRAEKKRQGAEADSGRFTYEYDILNRLTGVNRNGRLLRRYAYDAFGNRTLKEDYDGGTPVRTTYRYNEGNQLVSRTDGEEEQTYTYDLRGNLTAVSRGEGLLKAFTFDAANRMSSALQVKGGTERRAEYRYDAFGNRIGQKVYGGVTENGIPDMEKQGPKDPERQICYTIDLTRRYRNVLAAEDSAKQGVRTFYWDRNVAVMEEEGQGSYYLQDDLGSPMLLLDGEGEIRESYGFDEFGQALFPEQVGQAQPFGYTGYQMEEAGGLYYAQARRYDAGAGRFVSEDRERYRRFRWPKTLNQYIYCENNPTVYIDPSGNYIEDIYPTEPSRYAPVQVRISGNTITIDAYVDITGDINTEIEDMTTYDLAIEGIETWAGNYENIYGNKVKVEVNVYEKNGADGAQNLFRNKQEFLDIELRDGAGTAVTNRNGTWSIDNTGRITMYSCSSDGKDRNRKHYTDTVAHEFGHILGIDDGYEDKKYNTSRPVADMLEIYDMMRNNHMDKTYISDIDIQMMVIAASTNERQYFMTYGGHIQSKGVFIYEICDTD